jgi:hypothetical protein
MPPDGASGILRFAGRRTRIGRCGGRSPTDRAFQHISRDRRAAIVGKWSGTMEQDFRGRKVTYPGDLVFAVHGRELRGTLHVTLVAAGERLSPTFNLSGGFLHDRFARLDYVSQTKGTVHFGAMILELSPAADALTGRFVAFGAYAQQIVFGPIRLVKVNAS